MIQENHQCGKCGSINIIYNGHNQCGSPQYRCKDCGTCRVLKPKSKTQSIDLEALERAYLERNSDRAVARIFDISHTTVSRLLKKKARELPDFKSTVIEPKAEEAVEADEVYSYVLSKKNPIRIWIALNKSNKQILSFLIGDGTMKSRQKFWRKRPYEWLRQPSFSDLLQSYNCIPKETHTKVGKGTGLTNHIERLNNTIRQRFARLVRKTLSFSKKVYMLNLHFKYWAYHYNLQIQNNST